MAEKESLFGTVEVIESLAEQYLIPPFTILDTNSGEWLNRRKYWINRKVKAETGIQLDEVEETNSFRNCGLKSAIKIASEAVFDPVLCEVGYTWYCNNPNTSKNYTEGRKGRIIDFFNGSCVSGIVATMMGYDFTGIDIRETVIKQNYEHAKSIGLNPLPNWLIGDSNKVLDELVFEEEYDLLFSCPPYADLVEYSELEGDISNKPYDKFLELYRSIIYKGCALLKSGGFAFIVIGDARDKNGNLYGIIPDTVTAFKDAGMYYYNSAILRNSAGTAALRARGTFVRGKGKLVPIHQNILIFLKP